MLLLQHCVTYLKPVHRDMSVYEEWLGLPIEEWCAVPPEQYLYLKREFMRLAETCIIMGSTSLERRRIEQLYGKDIPEWYYDTNKECRGLPIRYTSPYR